MNEKEFDIQVRNLLQDAEESVSPRVWEGVAAGLDRRRRVVPFWLWGASVAAVAAAVIAGVVLLWPAATVEPSNLTISIAQENYPVSVTPAESPAVMSSQGAKTDQAAALRPVKGIKGTPAVAPESAATAIPSSNLMASAMPVQRQQLVPIKAAQPESYLEDALLLEQLARSEQKQESGRGLSIMAVGNLQGKNSRQDVPMSAGRGFAKAGLPQEGEFIEELSQDNFSLPFSAGLHLKYNFTPRWAVGVGVRYTNLSRTFMGAYHSGQGYDVGDPENPTSIDNTQHWLGVPLNVYYDIVNRGRWRVHTFAGGSYEFLLDNDFLVHAPKDLHYHQTGAHDMWSVGAGLGVEFKITPHVGLFLDPGVRYYLFNAEGMPRSLRTIQPLRFDIEAGLRFSLGKN